MVLIFFVEKICEQQFQNMHQCCKMEMFLSPSPPEMFTLPMSTFCDFSQFSFNCHEEWFIFFVSLLLKGDVKILLGDNT